MLILVLKNLQLEKLSRIKQGLLAAPMLSFLSWGSLPAPVCGALLFLTVVIPARIPFYLLFSLPCVLIWLNTSEYPLHVKVEFRLWSPWKKYKCGLLRSAKCRPPHRQPHVQSPLLGTTHILTGAWHLLCFQGPPSVHQNSEFWNTEGF